MSTAQDVFVRLLKEHGYSLTKARMAVFLALVGHEPLSMREVVLQARGINRASVYRAIDLFEKLGIVQRLNTGWKYKIELSDQFADHHHHLTCKQCGRTVALNEQQLEQFIENLAVAHGFLPLGHQIEIQGMCVACQKLKTTKAIS